MIIILKKKNIPIHCNTNAFTGAECLYNVANPVYMHNFNSMEVVHGLLAHPVLNLS